MLYKSHSILFHGHGEPVHTNSYSSLNCDSMKLLPFLSVDLVRSTQPHLLQLQGCTQYEHTEGAQRFYWPSPH
jgi:hypothetical protein